MKETEPMREVEGLVSRWDGDGDDENEDEDEASTICRGRGSVRCGDALMRCDAVVLVLSFHA